jgi:hypothetical protein
VINAVVIDVGDTRREPGRIFQPAFARSSCRPCRPVRQIVLVFSIWVSSPLTVT